MRVKFRIVIHKDGKKLSKGDLLGEKDPFLVGVRYITEFRYLEATKWLMLAQRLKAPSQDNPLNITPMGFIFVCTDKSEKYMLESLTFPQSKVYGQRVFAVRHKRS